MDRDRPGFRIGSARMGAAWAMAVLGLVGCDSDSPRLTLTGSSTVGPLAAEIGARFESQHPDARIDVQTGGSSRGIADARKGAADIGMVSRALRDEESDLHAFTIARDGICMIVHEDNRADALSESQIVDIYTGRITKWDRLSGRSGQIVVIHKADGRATQERFLAYFDLAASEVEPDVVAGDNEQVIKTVARNPDAIGYVSIGNAEYDVEEENVSIELLPLDGVDATTINVRNGSFPLRRELNLITGEPPEGLAKRFIDYARSERVHDIVQRLGYVPVGG